MALKYYVCSGSAGTTTIAAKDQFDAKRQYREETGRQCTKAQRS